jgi:putative membrane protein
MNFLAEYIPVFKSLHLIGMVTWFAGLFFLGRIFVYHAEADKQADGASVLKTNYLAMMWRLYKAIVNPSMMITWTFGLLMIAANPAYMSVESGTPGWLHAKLLFVVLLTVYHILCKKRIKKIEAGEPQDSYFLRVWNEVPTVFLVGIIFVAVFGKLGTLNWMYWGIGMLVFVILLYLAIKRINRK